MRYILKSIIAAAVSLFSIYATAQDNWPDKLYCRGGLADKSAWNPTKNYPLNHVGDGKYEGTVDVDASNEDSGDYYGNRSDLFFSYGNDDNRILSCPYSNIERFLTPAICEGPLQEYSQPENIYQTNGGSYFVNVDLKAMTVKITPLDTEDIAWMPEVFLVGTNYEEYWGRNGKSLPHIGGGIYRGTVHLLEGVNNPGYAEATVFATYTHRRDLNWAEGRYGSSDDLKVLQPGETAHCTRYYGDRKWLIAPGWYDVVFDMNKGEVTFNNVTDGIEQTTADNTGVRSGKGCIIIDGDFSKAEIFTAGGSLISKNSPRTDVSPGLYIVRTGYKTVKIMVK